MVKITMLSVGAIGSSFTILPTNRSSCTTSQKIRWRKSTWRIKRLRFLTNSNLRYENITNVPGKCLGKDPSNSVACSSGCCGKPAGPLGKAKPQMHFNSFSEAADAVKRFIHAGEGDFNEYACALFRLQSKRVLPLRNLCEAKKIVPEEITNWQNIPRYRPIPLVNLKSPASALMIALWCFTPVERRVPTQASTGTTTSHSRFTKRH